jgi:signal transduction histidine kinase
MKDKLNRGMQTLMVAHPQWGMGLMLLLLHVSLAWGIEGWWARAFLLAHYGLFLMWQPFWGGDKHLNAGSAALVVLGGVGLVAWGSWWPLALWLAVLTGLVGGNVSAVQSKRQRWVYLLAVFYLLAVLLLWVVPHVFGTLQGGVLGAYLVPYGLAALPVAIVFIRVEKRQPEVPYGMDFFYGLMLFLLVVVLVLGAFAVMVAARDEYGIALVKTLLAIAALLLTLSWLWNPHAGFGGLGQMLSRYLLSVGLPFERWLQNLAQLAERETDAGVFLQLALADLAALPWLSGAQWETPDGSGTFGAATPNSAQFSAYELRLTLHTRWPLSPALLLHVKLLAQLLGYFHAAKRRELALKQNAYTQAIYETGARLTHDVKNLLQSLKTLCAAAESTDSGRAEELQALIKRQLPQITQRLQLTLEKLQAPKAQAEANMLSAQLWWNNLKQRYANEGVEFAADRIDAALTVPADLFESVVENLLQNAVEKRRVQSGIRIGVSLASESGVALDVCDTGSAMPGAVADTLFKAPVKSESGLGIGLYQAAKQAEQLGYRLEVARNGKEGVCFRLRSIEQ